MAYRILLRRDTSTNWSENNPVLALGEPGYETDTGKLKIGDGSTTWNDLSEINGITGATGSVDFTSVSSDILPSEDRTYDIGATGPGNRWRNGYFQALYVDAGTIYIGDVPISSKEGSISVTSINIGPPGVTGSTLYLGDNGTIVVESEDGQTSQIGATGATGSAGAAGPTGPQGAAGATGSAGAAGPTGPAGSGAGISEITYSELLAGVTGSSLIEGTYYLITDFQTCYDQPDYNFSGNGITGDGTYRTAEIDPIIVFATSENTLDINAFQPSYPKDSIKYDITFSLTERTASPAKGRISERIDEFNNRTDYDHRTILFKRYIYYEIQLGNPYQGTVEVSSFSATEMTVSGTGSNFLSSVSVGNKVGFEPNNNDYRVYEVTNVASDTEMTITGLTTADLSPGTKMYSTDSSEYSSYYQNNVDDPSVFEEYYTFQGTDNFNNYIGNHANLYDYEGNEFILANNVFHTSFIGNKFGDNCYNNTFFDDCSNNNIGNNFHNNITDDDFDGNIIGNDFYNNRITANFNHNRIGENFYNNYIVQNSFYRNNIMNDFRDNEISGGDFQNNEIGNQFNDNKIYDDFYNNDIGNGYNNNESYSSYNRNLIGNGYNGNTVYSQFYENNIGQVFESNTIGLSANIGGSSFYGNNIGNDFQSNNILNDFQSNNILNDFYNNGTTGAFKYNTIGNNFSGNTTQDGFGFGGGSYRGNVIGNNFSNNTIGEYFYTNRITDNFTNNTVGDFFQNNDITYNGLNSNDFTLAYNGVATLSSSGGTGGSDGDWPNITQSATTLSGTGVLFDIQTSGGVVTNISVASTGKNYQIGEQITVDGASIGGATNLIITVDTLSETPLVYTTTNCTISNSIDDQPVITAVDLSLGTIYVSDSINAPYNP